MTTREEAVAALEVARATYNRWGYNDSIEKALVDWLIYGEKDAAELVRNHLWAYFPGGGTSTYVTREVFKALGRDDETDDGWC